MAYYSMYMNEKMVIDNWEYYKECNWMLSLLLAKDKRKTLKEKVDFYFEKRNVNEANWEMYNTKAFKVAYEDYLEKKYMYEDFLEYGEESGMCYQEFYPNKIFEMYSLSKREAKSKQEEKIMKMSKASSKLKEVNEVIIFKSDMKYLSAVREQFRITELQLQVMFGMIFFSRMNMEEKCKIDSAYRLKRFKGCFDRTICDEDMSVVETVGLFSFENDDWRYLHFEEKDEVAYIFRTTLDNNKLNLSLVAKEAIPDYDEKRCERCGDAYVPSSNRQYLCENCRKVVQREQARLRKRKQRGR